MRSVGKLTHTQLSKSELGKLAPITIRQTDTRQLTRSRGKCWMDNVKEWTPLPMPELLMMASRKIDWERISAESSLMFLQRPNRQRDRTEQVVVFSSREKVWENVRQFISACAFFFFFLVEIRSQTLIPLLRPGSVHSGSAS